MVCQTLHWRRYVLDRRERKIRGLWRRWQRRLKSELAYFQSSSRLFQLTNFVKCRRYSPRIQFLRKKDILKEKANFVVACLRSHVVVVLWRQRNVQKKCDHLQSCCFAYYDSVRKIDGKGVFFYLALFWVTVIWVVQLSDAVFLKWLSKWSRR